MVGDWTVGKLCIPINRGVRYVHDLLRELESEGRIFLSDEKRVSDRKITINS